MRFSRARGVSLGISVLVFATVIWVNAGSLTPPAGPVAPTMKTLGEVEPRIAIDATNTPGDADSLFKITQPGSYYLTGNIQGVAGKHGIEIASSNVSLDLMGFELIGAAATQDGVSATVFANSVRIINGTVSGWGGSGVNLQGSLVVSSIVESVIAHGNGASGIAVYSGVLRTCVASGNTFAGIRAQEASTITDCAASTNTGFGFLLEAKASISGCVATDNTGDGIAVLSSCHVLNNLCVSNGALVGDGAGIHVLSSNNRIEGNHCYRGDRGIDVDFGGNVIIRNTCSGATINNWDVAAGNVCLVVVATGTPAPFTGNFGGVAPGSTDPWVNFTY